MNQVIYNALLLGFYLIGIPLAAVTVVSFLVSVLQAATQLQDQTITLVPKIITLILTLCIGGGWMIEELELLFMQVMELIKKVGP